MPWEIVCVDRDLELQRVGFHGRGVISQKEMFSSWIGDGLILITIDIEKADVLVEELLSVGINRDDIV